MVDTWPLASPPPVDVGFIPVMSFEDVVHQLGVLSDVEQLQEHFLSHLSHFLFLLLVGSVLFGMYIIYHTLLICKWVNQDFFHKSFIRFIFTLSPSAMSSSTVFSQSRETTSI